MSIGRREAFTYLFWCFVLAAAGVGLLLAWGVNQALGMLIGCGAIAILLYGRYGEPHFIRVVFHTLGDEVDNRLRIVFLSDLHAGVTKGKRFYLRMAHRVEELKPDLVLYGGDFVDKEAKDLEVLEPLFMMRPPRGQWFVLGNHDFFDNPLALTQRLREEGLQDMTNASRTVVVGPDQSIEIVGLDDSMYGSPDLSLVTKQKNGRRIVLMHEPDLLLDLPEGCADLILLGHTHGGQIRVPIRGPILGLPQIAPQWLDAGEKIWRGMRIIISRGIGESLVQARLGSRPEIVVVDVT